MTNYDHVVASGFGYPESLIHLFTGGSALHGAKVNQTDDHDVFGVFIERPSNILGLDPQAHFVWGTSGIGLRNGPEDVDVCLYGLRKFVGLACKGNPSVLHFLFAPADELPSDEKHVIWTWLLKHRNELLAVSHHKQFIGYARAQLARMVGERAKKVNRPELVDLYGFDTKFAMHVIRVLLECEELLTTGELTFPNPKADFLIDIRQGRLNPDRIIQLANDLIDRNIELSKTCTTMRQVIDRQEVSRIIGTMYRSYWQIFPMG
jgi:uncharacterized protein